MCADKVCLLLTLDLIDNYTFSDTALFVFQESKSYIKIQEFPVYPSTFI